METVLISADQVQAIAEGIARVSAGIWFALGFWLYQIARDSIDKGW